MSGYKNTIIWIIPLLIFCSCDLILDEPPPDINDPRIIREARMRLDQYRDQKIQNCMEKILEEAEIYVDTTIANIIDDLLMDTTFYPARPARPESPGKITLDSGFQPVPLFDQKLKGKVVDSLIRIIPTVDTTSNQ